MEIEEKNIENQELDDENEMQTVGGILRRARLKKGKTLNDVATELCIRRVYLEAIENVECKSLPVEPYRLGYVRNYAEYLGLNSARIVQSFKETALPKGNGKRNLKAVGEEFDYNGPGIKHIIIGMLALCAIVVCGYFYNKYSKEPQVEIVNEAPADVYPTPVILEETNDTVTSEEVPAVNEPEQEQAQAQAPEEEIVVEEEQESEAEAAENNEAAETNSGPRVRFVLTGDSWIELKHGDEVLLAKVYHKGFEYEIPYNEDLEISVGKHDNVQFYIDGELTEVATARKQTKIKLDKFLEKR